MRDVPTAAPPAAQPGDYHAQRGPVPGADRDQGRRQPIARTARGRGTSGVLAGLGTTVTFAALAMLPPGSSHLADTAWNRDTGRSSVAVRSP